jgi:hypothetical protein
MTIGPYTIEIEYIIRGLTLAGMLTGLLVVPFLPGLVIIWLVSIAYGIAAGFGTLGWVMLALITVLMLVGSILDNVLMGTQAHKEGAPWWVVLVAFVAALPGNALIPIVGWILLAMVVMFLIQWSRMKDARAALNSIKGMLIGYGWAFAFRFIIGMVMIGLWLIWAWA